MKRMPAATPAATQKREYMVGKRDGPILAAFGSAYVEEHRPCVDVAGCQSERFVQTYSTGLNGCREDVVVEGRRVRGNPYDLLLCEDDREVALVFGAKNRAERPLPIQHGLEVKRDAGVAEPQRRRTLAASDPMRASSAHTTGRENSPLIILLKIVCDMRRL